MEKTMSVSEAASRLGVHTETIKRWARAGKLQGAGWRFGSKRLGWGIPVATIEAIENGGYWLKNGNLQLPLASKSAL